MSKSLTDQRLIDFTRFVATKFASNHTPWVYTRDLDGLKHIRYESDYTGYNHWTKRLKRAFNPKELFETKNSLMVRAGLKRRKFTFKRFFTHAYWHIVVALQKSNNLPDGRINGNITFWEEDGEYIAMMGPTVGVKVLDFLEAEPDNEHAKAILAAMREAHDASWGKKVDEEND